MRGRWTDGPGRPPPAGATVRLRRPEREVGVVAPWDRRSASEQARVETLVLARWLPGAVATARFHAARYGDVDDRSLTDRAHLRRLAPTRELDLRADAPAGASSVLRPTVAQVKASADGATLARIARAMGREGPSGGRDAILHEYRPIQLHRAGPDGALHIASSRTDLDRMHRTGARAAAVLGLTDTDVVVSAVPAGPTLDHLGTVHLAAGAGLTAMHARGSGDGLDVVAAAFTSLPVSVVVVPADEARSLAEVLGASAVDTGDLRMVVLLGPPPVDRDRAAVVAAFAALGVDAQVRALWGPSAGRVLYAECADGSGLHTYPDLEVLELVDPMTGTPVAGPGDLTVTSAGWHGTALVRFQTGTWVDAIDPSPCASCRRTVPRLIGQVVPAAWERRIATSTGTRHVDLRGVAAVVATLPGATSWRAELRRPREPDAGDRLIVEIGGPRTQLDPDAVLARVVAATGAETAEVAVGLTDDEVQAGVDAAGGVLADRR